MAEPFLLRVSAGWPEFAALRGAASAFSSRQRLPQMVSIVINELRVAFAAALRLELSVAKQGLLTRDIEIRDLRERARSVFPGRE